MKISKLFEVDPLALKKWEDVNVRPPVWDVIEPQLTERWSDDPDTAKRFVDYGRKGKAGVYIVTPRRNDGNVTIGFNEVEVAIDPAEIHATPAPARKNGPRLGK